MQRNATGGDVTRKVKLVKDMQLIKLINVIQHSSIIQSKRGKLRKLSTA